MHLGDYVLPIVTSTLLFAAGVGVGYGATPRLEALALKRTEETLARIAVEDVARVCRTDLYQRCIMQAERSYGTTPEQTCARAAREVCDLDD